MVTRYIIYKADADAGGGTDVEGQQKTAATISTLNVVSHNLLEEPIQMDASFVAGLESLYLVQRELVARYTPVPKTFPANPSTTTRNRSRQRRRRRILTAGEEGQTETGDGAAGGASSGSGAAGVSSGSASGVEADLGWPKHLRIVFPFLYDGVAASDMCGFGKVPVSTTGGGAGSTSATPTCKYLHGAVGFSNGLVFLFQHRPKSAKGLVYWTYDATHGTILNGAANSQESSSGSTKGNNMKPIAYAIDDFFPGKQHLDGSPFCHNNVNSRDVGVFGLRDQNGIAFVCGGVCDASGDSLSCVCDASVGVIVIPLGTLVHWYSYSSGFT